VDIAEAAQADFGDQELTLTTSLVEVLREFAGHAQQRQPSGLVLPTEPQSTKALAVDEPDVSGSESAMGRAVALHESAPLPAPGMQTCDEHILLPAGTSVQDLHEPSVFAPVDWVKQLGLGFQSSVAAAPGETVNVPRPMRLQAQVADPHLAGAPAPETSVKGHLHQCRSHREDHDDPTCDTMTDTYRLRERPPSLRVRI